MPAHSEESDADHRLLVIAAARLCSEGLTQAQIATRLRRSQPDISRLLASAKKQRFLAASPAFLEKNVKPRDLGEVERKYFASEELCEALRKLAPEMLQLDVHVLPDGDEEFTTAAAGCLVDLLRQARVVGIMWGRTAQRLVSSIRAHVGIFAQSQSFEAQCIPLCGDPVHLMNLGHVKYSASQLAAELGQVLNPSRPSDQPCLVGVPAYLPRRLFLRRGGATANWEHFVQEIPGYREIFGPNNGKGKPWIERVDAIISGAGIIMPEPRKQDQKAQITPTAAHEETGDFISERLRQEEGITLTTLARLVYGDIGGWLLERPGLGLAERKLVASLNQGWTGIKDNHLEDVARSAKPGGGPGIILVVAGAAKAEMVKELVRRGFVNVLLIDSSLAAALKS